MPITLVIAGGGTGGHLYPGLAVARELRRRSPEARVSFVGTARGIEARIVPREGFDLDLIRSAGLKGKSLAARARGGLLVPVGLADAWRVVSRRRPHVVMGVGGYSSGPVVLVAALRRVPTMVLEQNAVPGLTNRLLAPFVRAAAVTYQQSLPFFRGKAFVAGNPVRAEFFAAGEGDAARAGATGRRVLVLGGSLGAHAVNVALVAAAPRIVAGVPGVTVVHQTGERDLAAVRDGYARANVRAEVQPFFDQVAVEMAAADLVIGRAGATTLAELAATGRAAVLIPFPAATDDHQRRNAVALAEAGAAIVIDEGSLTPDRLADAVCRLLTDDAGRATMAAAMKAQARPDAAARIVDRIVELAGSPASLAA